MNMPTTQEQAARYREEKHSQYLKHMRDEIKKAITLILLDEKTKAIGILEKL